MALVYLGDWYNDEVGNCEIDGNCDMINVPMGLSPKMQSDPDAGATVAAWFTDLVNGMTVEMRDGSGNKRTIVIGSKMNTGGHYEISGTVTDTGTIGVNTMFGMYWGYNDTPNVTLSVEPSSVSENVASATVRATCDITPGSDVLVTLAMSGTAVKDTDYSMSNTVITIPSGILTGAITIGTFDNTVYEPSKTAIFDIDSITGANENGTQQVTLTITSDDPQPTVNLARSVDNIAENLGKSYISALLSNPSTDNVTVSFSLSGAVNNTDYTLSTDTIIITSGNTSGSISITALSDTVHEGNQSVIFDFSVTNGTKGSTTSITIVDDDPLITIDSDVSTFHEANDVATIFAYSSFTKASNIIVDLAFNGTATDVLDYSRSGSSITIPSGSTSGSMQVIALVDAVSDPNETIIVSVDTVTGAVEDGTQSLTLTILEVSTNTAPRTHVGLGLKIGLGL